MNGTYEPRGVGVLTIVESLPPGLLEAAPTDLHRILPGPTLIHLS